MLTQTFGILIVKSLPELAKADIFGYNMFAKQDKINVIFKSIFCRRLNCMSSYNVNVNESPNHFIILDAIARGMTNVNNIAKVTKLHKVEIELIVNDLLTQRLIVKSEIRGFLGRKKTEIRTTETGIKLINTKKQELEQKLEKVQHWYNNGDRSRLESFMDSNRAWIPMMLFSGIMNAMFFISMMSLMGMAMNPAESAMAGGGGGGHDNQDTHSVADDGNNNDNNNLEHPDHAGTGGDYSNVDSTSFQGFDGGGGFDSF